MLLHMLRMLARAFVDFPSVLSGNWLSFLLPLSLYVAKEFNTFRKGKWASVKAHIQRDTWILAGAYVLLFGWAVVRTIYQDHESLAAKAQDLRHQLSANAATNQSQISVLETRCARDEGITDTLSKQNRDQQNTINSCQNQALKLLAPKNHTMTVLVLKEFDPNVQDQDIEWLFLTNTIVSPFRVEIRCQMPFEVTSAGVVGGPSMGPGAQKLAPNESIVEMDTPAWSPNAPFRVKMIVHSNHASNCRFAEV